MDDTNSELIRYMDAVKTANIKISELEESLKKARQTPCEWCVSTTNSIESHEQTKLDLIDIAQSMLAAGNFTQEWRIEYTSQLRRISNA